MAEPAKTGHYMKFKDKASQKWFRTDHFPDRLSMLDHYWKHTRAAAAEVEFYSPKGKLKEDTEMSVKDFIAQTLEGNVSALKDTFNSVMDAHIDGIIDDLRPSSYADVFGAPQIAEGPYDSEDEDFGDDLDADDIEESEKPDTRDHFRDKLKRRVKIATDQKKKAQKSDED